LELLFFLIINFLKSNFFKNDFALVMNFLTHLSLCLCHVYESLSFNLMFLQLLKSLNGQNQKHLHQINLWNLMSVFLLYRCFILILFSQVNKRHLSFSIKIASQLAILLSLNHHFSSLITIHAKTLTVFLLNSSVLRHQNNPVEPLSHYKANFINPFHLLFPILIIT